MNFNGYHIISIFVGSYLAFYVFQWDLPSSKRGSEKC